MAGLGDSLLMQQLPSLLVAVPLSFVPLLYFLEKVGVPARGAALAGMGLCLLLSFLPWVEGTELPISASPGGWGGLLGIELLLDGRARLFLPVISAGVFVSALFGTRWSQRWPLSFYTLVFLLFTGANGLLLTNDLFNAFVFVEIAGIATHALVAFRGDGDGLESAFKYLMAAAVGGILILWGIVLVFTATGTLWIPLAAERLADAPPVFVAGAAVLLASGIALKGGLVPMHAWKADGLAGAPSAVAALLSGPILTALFGFGLRILYGLFGGFPVMEGASAVTGGVEGSFGVLGSAGEVRELLRGMVFVVAVSSIVAGHVMALAQSRMKRMLAYSSIAHMGYIVVGVGAGGEAALAAALTHAITHAFMKVGWFFVCGELRRTRGTDRIAAARGAFREAPWLGGAAILFSMSLVGIPPAAGFGSKWVLVLESANAGAWGGAVAIAAGGALALPYYLRIVVRGFEPGRPRAATPVPWDSSESPSCPEPAAELPEGAPPHDTTGALGVRAVAILVCAALILGGFAGYGLLFSEAFSVATELVGSVL